MGEMCDEAPQPVSGAMSEQTADWYVAYTHGRLRKFQHADGNWYLYAPQPAPVGVTPDAGTTTGTAVQAGSGR